MRPRRITPNLVSFCQVLIRVSLWFHVRINLTVLKFDSVGAAKAHYDDRVERP